MRRCPRPALGPLTLMPSRASSASLALRAAVPGGCWYQPGILIVALQVIRSSRTLTIVKSPPIEM